MLDFNNDILRLSFISVSKNSYWFIYSLNLILKSHEVHNHDQNSMIFLKVLSNLIELGH